MKDDDLRIVGIDTASGDDWTSEVFGIRLPDGGLEITSMHRYKSTIDGELTRCPDCGAEWTPESAGEIHQHDCPRLARRLGRSSP